MKLEKVSLWRCVSHSNLIRAHWETHGLDCNPPTSLPPWFVCTIPLSLSGSYTVVPHLSPKLSQSTSLPFNLPLTQLLGFSCSLSPPCSLTHLHTSFYKQCQSVFDWEYATTFWSISMFWWLSTTIILRILAFWCEFSKCYFIFWW